MSQFTEPETRPADPHVKLRGADVPLLDVPEDVRVCVKGDLKEHAPQEMWDLGADAQDWRQVPPIESYDDEDFKDEMSDALGG